MKEGSFGACTFDSVSPKALSASTTTLNVALSFEEALKLNLAIDEAVHQLGRYHRATRAAKRMGVRFVIHINKKRVRVLKGRLAPRSTNASRQSQ